MKFIGWIPNLRGRLSFDTIGSSTKPYPYLKYKHFSHSLVLQENRKLNDSAVPRSLRKWLFEFKYSPLRFFSKISKTIEKLCYHSGDFRFSFYYSLIEEEENKKDSLNGYVIIEPSIFLEKHQCHNVLENEELLKSMSIPSIQDILDRSLIVTKIKIFRDGFCELENLYLRKIQRDNLLWTATVPEGFDKFIEEVAHQTYYFIKDVCHQHQHHDSKTDNLLPLVKCDESNENRSYETLAINIFKSLYRLILKKRRAESIKEFYSMKGILCYLKSFRKIASSRRISVKNFQSEDDLFLSGSIEAKSNCLAAGRERKKNFIGMMPSIISLPVSFLALCFAFSSMIMIYNKNIGESSVSNGSASKISLNVYIELIQYLIMHPLQLFGISFSILFTFFFVSSDLFKESRFYHDFWRIVYGFKSQVFVSIFLAGCGILSLYFSIDYIEPNFKIFISDTFYNLFHPIIDKFYTCASDTFHNMLNI